MKAIYIIISLLASTGALHAELKSRSEALLEKLAEFESSERFKTEVAIEQKRKEVAKVLKSYRDQALEAKDLEKANKLQAKIEELEKGKPVRPEEDPILGMWKTHNGAALAFYPDGTMFCKHGSRYFKLKWRRKMDNDYTLYWADGATTSASIDGDVLTDLSGPHKGKTCHRVK